MTAFEKLNGLPDDMIEEYLAWSTASESRISPKVPNVMSRFMSSGWGVAVLCCVVALSVMVGIIQAGRHPATPPAGDSHPITDGQESVTEPTYTEESMNMTETDGEDAEETLEIYEDLGIQYTSNQNGTCFVSGLTSDFSGALSIPSTTPRGETVTAVGDRAFYSSHITSVTLPDTVTSIGEKAFWGCMALKEIVMCDGLTDIGKGAFEGCTSLTTVTIPEGVVVLREDTFYGCYNLKNIHLPASILALYEDSLTDCTKLTAIYYKGTAEMWDEVDIWSMFALDSVRIYCES